MQQRDLPVRIKTAGGRRRERTRPSNLQDVFRISRGASILLLQDFYIYNIHYLQCNVHAIKVFKKHYNNPNYVTDGR